MPLPIKRLLKAKKATGRLKKAAKKTGKFLKKHKTGLLINLGIIGGATLSYGMKKASDKKLLAQGIKEGKIKITKRDTPKTIREKVLNYKAKKMFPYAPQYKRKRRK